MREEFKALILDPGYSRGRTSLHMKTMDYLWQEKFVLGRALVDRGEAHEAILLKLDELSNNMQQISNHLKIKLDNSIPVDIDIKLQIG